MKKITLALASLLVAASAAHAESLQLNYIDTDNCARAQSEIRLLNASNQGIYVDSQCAGPGYYSSDNGRVYAYRLYTSVNVPYSIYPGQEMQLNFIDTNDCSFAVSEIRLLNSQQISVEPFCEGPGYFPSDNGMAYRYRVVTRVRVNY